MKKTKLLTPILGLSTLVGAAAPLAALTSCSCSKDFDGKVSADEWKAAISVMANENLDSHYYTNGTWSSTTYADGKPGVTEQYNNAIVDGEKQSAEYNYREWTTTPTSASGTRYSQAFNGFYMNGLDPAPSTNYLPGLGNSSITSDWKYLVSDMKNVDPNDPTTGYLFDEEQQTYFFAGTLSVEYPDWQTAVVELSVKFNSDKQVENFSYIYHIINTTKQTIIGTSWCNLTFKYKSKDVSLPDGWMEHANNNYKTVPAGSPTYYVNLPQQTDTFSSNFILSIPGDADLGSITKITIQQTAPTTSIPVSSPAVLFNGVELPYVDGGVVKTGYKYESGTIVLVGYELNANDTLTICCQPNVSLTSSESTWQVTLA